MKTATEFKEHLLKLRACEEAREWAEGKTTSETWEQCERGDWLLWWCQKEGVSLELLTLAKGKVAETVIHLMKDQRSKDAVYAAIAFGEGKITREELDEKRRAAYAAYAAAYAAADAAYAAYADAAADAAYAAAYAADAAYAAAYAAYAAAYAAAARSKAHKENQLLTANIVRSIIKPDFL